MRNAPFASLSYRGQVPRLRGLAAAALAQYGLEGAQIALLAHRGNTLFRVDAPGGRRWVLRVYGPDHPDPAPIRSELLWLAALARETDLGVPAPLPAATGALLTTATAPGVPTPRPVTASYLPPLRPACARSCPCSIAVRPPAG